MTKRPPMRRIEGGWTGKDRHVTIRCARGANKWRTLMNNDSLEVQQILEDFDSGRLSRRQALKALAATSVAAAVAPSLRAARLLPARRWGRGEFRWHDRITR